MSFEWIFHPLSDDFNMSVMEILSQPELIEFQKISHKHRKNEFLQSRYQVKNFLQKKLNLSLVEIELMRDQNGRPRCALYSGDFNWSHSGPYMTAVFSEDLNVGVDLEQIHQKESYLALSKKVLTTVESEHLMSYPLSEQHVLFYKYWTAKEAIIKTAGGGGFKHAQQIQINLFKEKVEFLPPSFGEIPNWSLQWDEPIAGYLRATAGYLPASKSLLK